MPYASLVREQPIKNVFSIRATDLNSDDEHHESDEEHEMGWLLPGFGWWSCPRAHLPKLISLDSGRGIHRVSGKAT